MYLKLPKEMLSYNSRVNMARDKTFFMKFVIENPYPEYEEVIKIKKMKTTECMQIWLLNMAWTTTNG